MNTDSISLFSDLEKPIVSRVPHLGVRIPIPSKVATASSDEPTSAMAKIFCQKI
jgi:hypothetical protein